MQIIYRLPKAQQNAAKAVKLLQAALLSMLKQKHSAKQQDYGRTDSNALDTATVNFLLMLGRMSDSYKLERDAFLKQMQGSRTLGTGSKDTGNGSIDTPDDATAAKRQGIGSDAGCVHVF